MGPIDNPIAIIAAGLVVLGIVVVMIARKQNTSTTPALLHQRNFDADKSTIMNLTNTIHSIVNERESEYDPNVPSTI